MTEAIARRGILFVLSSPSGTGKTTIARELLETDKAFRLSVSATTRPPRDGEREGVDYYFLAQERFDAMVTSHDLLEHARVFGYSYGTPRAPVKDAILNGYDVLFDVDWQGAQQLRHSDLGQFVVSVFVLPPSIAALEQRLRARGLDSDAVIAERMGRAWEEICHWAEYDYVLVNDDFESCFSRIRTIIAAERMRPVRQTWLFPHVEQLYLEFEERDVR